MPISPTIKTCLLTFLVCLSASSGLAKKFPFPGSYVYLGFTRDQTTGGPIATAKIPVRASQATLEGWTQSATGEWTNPFFPLLSLVYGPPASDPLLAEMMVSGPRADLVNPTFYEDGENGLGVWKVSFEGKTKSLVEVNGFDIPELVSDAETEGWEEGGCSPFMGGSHYYKEDGAEGDWSEVPPLVPIYDKYGSGNLNSFILLFGNFGTTFGYFPSFPIPNNGLGFDGFGIAILSAENCKFNFCNQQDCLDLVASEGDDGLTGMHVMFNDPADAQEWGTCQEPNPIDCEMGCTCCGTPSAPIENVCSASPVWLPPI